MQLNSHHFRLNETFQFLWCYPQNKIVLIIPIIHASPLRVSFSSFCFSCRPSVSCLVIHYLCQSFRLEFLHDFLPFLRCSEAPATLTNQHPFPKPTFSPAPFFPIMSHCPNSPLPCLLWSFPLCLLGTWHGCRVPNVPQTRFFFFLSPIIKLLSLLSPEATRITLAEKALLKNRAAPGRRDTRSDVKRKGQRALRANVWWPCWKFGRVQKGKWRRHERCNTPKTFIWSPEQPRNQEVRG